jgi:hypothetical protein
LSKASQKSFDNCFKTSGLATASFKNPKSGKWMQNASEFHEGAADVLTDINNHEGVSVELLAVTWMNESSFKFGPLPHTNPGNSYDWDYGPFQLNPRWIDRDIFKGNIKNSGDNWLSTFDVYGLTVGDANQGFDGDPAANGRMAARRMYWGKTDREKAMNFTKPTSREERGISYDNFAPLFRQFFDCYK